MYMPSIFGNFDDLMDFTFPEIGKEAFGRRTDALMRTDIVDAGDNYEMHIDLPGLKKDEIELSLEKGMLKITVSRDTGMQENEKDGKKFLRRERYAGTISRSFYVGENLTFKDIKARYESGVLTITVPKAPKQPVETSYRIAID